MTRPAILPSAPACAAAARIAGPQRRHPADEIARLIRELEELERQARNAQSAEAIDDCEELTQRYASELRAVYRRPAQAPSAKPRWASADGLSAGW